MVAIVGVLLVGNVKVFNLGPTAPSTAASHYMAGTKAQFSYLAAQNSNSCGLQPSTVQSYANSARIQGSCCIPMDWNHYRLQVRGLRQYRRITAIPRDPYDISAALAKRLFAYESSIHLTAAQQAAYDRAMTITPEKGPCCCMCWRWHAFAGLAKYLITHKHLNAHGVAKVISLVDGCGGKA
jgi:hypothetical protein